MRRENQLNTQREVRKYLHLVNTGMMGTIEKIITTDEKTNITTKSHFGQLFEWKL